MVLLRGDEKMLVLRFFVWLVSLLSFGFVSLGTVTYGLVDEGESFDQSITFEEYLIDNNINFVMLDNLVENGDFSVDSNSDGLADEWVNYATLPAFTILNGQRLQYTNSTGLPKTNGIVANNFIAVTPGTKIYVGINAKKDVSDTTNTYIFFGVRTYNGTTAISNTMISKELTTSFTMFSEVLTISDEGVTQYKPILSRIVFNTLFSDYTVNDFMQFNVSTLIANKQYSQLYTTTFDLMTDIEIKTQMDAWVNGSYVGIDDLDFQALYEEFFDEEFVDFELSDLDVEKNVEYTFIANELSINDVVLMISFGLFWVLIIRMIGGIIYVRFNS
jgi:hypothetical protein